MSYGLEIYNADGKVVVANGDKSLFLGSEYTLNNYINSSNFRTYTSRTEGYYTASFTNVNTATNPHICRSIGLNFAFSGRDFNTAYDYSVPLYREVSTSDSLQILSTNDPNLNSNWSNHPYQKLFYMPVGGGVSFSSQSGIWLYHSGRLDQVLNLFHTWNTGVKFRNVELPVQPTGGYGMAAYDSAGTCTFNSSQALALFSSINTFALPKVPDGYVQSGALYDWHVASQTINTTNSTGWVGLSPVGSWVMSDASGRFRRLQDTALVRTSSTSYTFYAIWAAYNLTSFALPNIVPNVTFYAGNVV